jgi:tetratricopeptide (TPR) repeat protein
MLPKALVILASVVALTASAQAQTLQFTSALGTKFESLRDNQGVVAAAEKALAADPKNVSLLLKLAQAQASVWQDREAVETLTRALAINPQNADLYTERGHRRLPLRQFSEARADLTRSVALDPKNVEAYYHLGLSHYFLGEFPKAADAFQHAVDLAPNTDSRINSTNWLYASLRRANQPQQAKEALAAITPEMSNSEPHTRFYLNLVRFFQGAMPEAQALPPDPVREGADFEPELAYDTVAYGIGNWHLYQHDTAKAQEYFRSVLKGRVWITWGFVGSETEMVRLGGKAGAKAR